MTSAFGVERVEPGTAGFSEQGLRALDAAMQAKIECGQVAGILTLLVRGGCVVHRGLYGHADMQADKPVEEDTIFRIFSMTKPVTVLAAMMMRQEGCFDLDAPIAEFIPEMKDMQVLVGMTDTGIKTEPLRRSITIFDLLTHTSGIGYGLDSSTPIEALYQQAEIMRPDEPLADKVLRIAHLPLHHQPGERYTYSLGTDILGRLVEITSGMELDSFFRERIFEPLGMIDTDFYVPAEKMHRLAVLYTAHPGGGLLDLATYPGDPAQFPFGLWTDKSRKPAFLSGGGGLVSTAADYLRFGRMLRGMGELDGVRLVEPETVRLITTPQLGSTLLNLPGLGFGFGFTILTDPAQAQIPGSIGAYAAGGAAHTDFWYDPGHDLMGLLMTQYIHYTGLMLPVEFKILAQGAIEA